MSVRSTTADLVHTEERARGNVTVLAQMLAGAPRPTRCSPRRPRPRSGCGSTRSKRALTRLLADSPVAEVIDTAGLARAVSAGFVGLELYEGVDPAGAEAALDALVEVVDDLGPVARRAPRGKLRRTAR